MLALVASSAVVAIPGYANGVSIRESLLESVRATLAAAREELRGTKHRWGYCGRRVVRSLRVIESGGGEGGASSPVSDASVEWRINRALYRCSFTSSVFTANLAALVDLRTDALARDAESLADGCSQSDASACPGLRLTGGRLKAKLALRHWWGLSNLPSDARANLRMARFLDRGVRKALRMPRRTSLRIVARREDGRELLRIDGVEAAVVVSDDAQQATVAAEVPWSASDSGPPCRLNLAFSAPLAPGEEDGTFDVEASVSCDAHGGGCRWAAASGGLDAGTMTVRLESIDLAAGRIDLSLGRLPGGAGCPRVSDTIDVSVEFIVVW